MGQAAYDRNAVRRRRAPQTQKPPLRVEKGAVKAPLKGELSAQLTEGFRLGLSQASPKANT